MAEIVEKRFREPHRLPPEEKERLVGILREELAGRRDVAFAYVHGSFVRSEAFRDIDVAVEAPGADAFDFETELEEELSHRTGFDVDVQALEGAPLGFQMAVLRDGRLLCSRDEPLRLEMIDRVSRLHRDYAHLRNVFLGIDGLRR